MKIKDIKLGSVILVRLGIIESTWLDWIPHSDMIIENLGGLHSGIYVGNGRYVSFEDKQINMNLLHEFKGKGSRISTTIYIEDKSEDDPSISNIALAMHGEFFDREGVERSDMGSSYNKNATQYMEKYDWIFNNCHSFVQLCTYADEYISDRINTSRSLRNNSEWKPFQMDIDYLGVITMPEPIYADNTSPDSMLSRELLVNSIINKVDNRSTRESIRMCGTITWEIAFGTIDEYALESVKDEFKSNKENITEDTELLGMICKCKDLRGQYGLSDKVVRSIVRYLEHQEKRQDRIFELVHKDYLKNREKEFASRKWDRRKEAASDVMSMLNPLNLFRDPVYA